MRGQDVIPRAPIAVATLASILAAACGCAAGPFVPTREIDASLSRISAEAEIRKVTRNGSNSRVIKQVTFSDDRMSFRPKRPAYRSGSFSQCDLVFDKTRWIATEPVDRGDGVFISTVRFGDFEHHYDIERGGETFVDEISDFYAIEAYNMIFVEGGDDEVLKFLDALTSLGIVGDD